MRQLIPRNTLKSMIACKKSGAKNRRKFNCIEYETDEIKSENKDLVVQNRNIVYAFSAIGLMLAFFYYSKSKAKTANV
jgi:hypothetical protein